MADKPFSDLVIPGFAGGLNRKFEAKDIGDNQSPYMKNWDFDGKGSIITRRGMVLFGESSILSGHINNIFNFHTAGGWERPFYFTGTSARYYHPMLSTWEYFQGSFTADQQFGSSPFLTSGGESYVHYCNARESMYRWEGVIDLLSTSIYANYDTLADAVVSGTSMVRIDGNTSAFSAPGSGFIGDDYFTWGGLSAGNQYLVSCDRITSAGAIGATIYQIPSSLILSGNTSCWLNGPTPSPGSAYLNEYYITYGDVYPTSNILISVFGQVSNQVSGVGIVKAAEEITTSTVPKGNIIVTHEQRLYVAGVSSYPQTMYDSQVGDGTDFSWTAGAAVPAEGGVEYFPEGGGPITSLAVKDRVIVFKNDAIKTFELATSGEIPVIKGGFQGGAINHKGTTNSEGNVFFINKNEGLKILTDASVETNNLTTQPIMDALKPDLETLGLTSAYSYQFYPRIYLGCAETSTTSFNNKLYWYDYTYQAWGEYNNWNFSQLVKYEDKLYGAGANSRNVYQLFNGFTDEGQPYLCSWKSKEFNYDTPHEFKTMRWLFIEGYMSQNAVLSASILYNGTSAMVQTDVLYGNGGYVNNLTGSYTYNAYPYATAPYAGYTGAGLTLNPFFIRIPYSWVDFKSMQVRFDTQVSGSAVKITNIVPYVEKLEGEFFPSANILV